jgi:hypothetical protein
MAAGSALMMTASSSHLRMEHNPGRNRFYRFDARTRGRRSYAGATGYHFGGNPIPKHRRA